MLKLNSSSVSKTTLALPIQIQLLLKLNPLFSVIATDKPVIIQIQLLLKLNFIWYYISVVRNYNSNTTLVKVKSPLRAEQFRSFLIQIQLLLKLNFQFILLLLGYLQIQIQLLLKLNLSSIVTAHAKFLDSNTTLVKVK